MAFLDHVTLTYLPFWICDSGNNNEYYFCNYYYYYIFAFFFPLFYSSDKAALLSESCDVDSGKVKSRWVAGISLFSHLYCETNVSCSSGRFCRFHDISWKLQNLNLEETSLCFPWRYIFKSINYCITFVSLSVDFQWESIWSKAARKSNEKKVKLVLSRQE